MSSQFCPGNETHVCTVIYKHGYESRCIDFSRTRFIYERWCVFLRYHQSQCTTRCTAPLGAFLCRCSGATRRQRRLASVSQCRLSQCPGIAEHGYIRLPGGDDQPLPPSLFNPLRSDTPSRWRWGSCRCIEPLYILMEWHRLQNYHNGSTTSSHSWSGEVCSSASRLLDKPSLVVLRHSKSISVYIMAVIWYEMRRRKPKPTLLTTLGVFILPHHIGM